MLMKIKIVLDRKNKFEITSIPDSVNSYRGYSLLKLENLTIIIKTAHKVTHEIFNNKRLTLDDLKDNLYRLKKVYSFIAFDQQENCLASGDFNNTSPVYYSVSETEVTLGFDPYLLSQELKSNLDKVYFSMRIIDFDSVYPFSELTPWENIKYLQSIDTIRVFDGKFSIKTSWTIPQNDKNIEELKYELKSILVSKLNNRLSHDNLVSADLSGGLDSTSLCYFCKELDINLDTLFLSPESGADSDLYWSDLASEEVSNSHSRWSYNEAVTLCHISEQEVFNSMPFGPSESFRYLSLARKISENCKKKGIKIHLNGHGGDELFGPLATMAWSLFHSKYPKRYRNLFGFARLNKYKLFRFYRSLVDNSTLTQNLKELKCEDISQVDVDIKYSSKWINNPEVPNYVTGFAKKLIKQCAVSYGDSEINSYANDKSVHQVLESMNMHTLLQRDMNAMVDCQEDFSFWSPFTEFDIVELAIQMNIDERFNAKVVKPLLAAIKPDNMPDDYFNRRDKGEYSKSTFEEFSLRKNSLQDTFSSDCIVYDMNLVNKQELLQALNSFSVDGELFESIMRIQIIELWLRGLNSREVKI